MSNHLATIEREIQDASVEDQREILRRLPHLLKFSAEDFQLISASERSFDFWDNSEDAIYDEL